MKRFLISISTCLFLLSLGLDANVARAQTQKPKKDLNQASVDGELDRVKELVSGGADVNTKNRMGMTPLVVAAMNNRTAVCEFLVENGADLNATDAQSRTAASTSWRPERRNTRSPASRRGTFARGAACRAGSSRERARTEGWRDRTPRSPASSTPSRRPSWH